MSELLLVLIVSAMFILGLVALGLGFVTLIQRGGRARFRKKGAAGALEVTISTADDNSNKRSLHESEETLNKKPELEARLLQRQLAQNNPETSED